MPPPHPLAVFVVVVLSCALLARSQQPYGSEIADCNNRHNDTGLLGYFCTATDKPACQSYLTFHAQPPYTTVASISALLGANPAAVAQTNSVETAAAAFAPNTKILVPVNCSCMGPHYQYNTTYQVRANDTFLTIANNMFQGLSTCQALHDQNGDAPPQSLLPGQDLTVPLRCACPSANQSRDGVKYLVSYLVDVFDDVSKIAGRFGVEAGSIEAANEMASSTVFPDTTLLIPVNSEPNASMLVSPPPPPPPPPPASVPSRRSSNHARVYIGVGVAVAVLSVVASVVAVLVLKARRKRVSTVLASDGFAEKDSKPSGTAGDVSVSIDDMLSRISDIGSSLKVYKYKELCAATDDFSPDRRVGGAVYRAVFNGDAAAVEAMDQDVSTEVEVMKRINHFNLIRLIGLCFHQGRWYLVSQYAENGQLRDRLLAGRTDGATALSWRQRVQIALDISEGLRYLHGYTQPPYVHMDISSSAVLLDEALRAKIRSFGSARLIGGSSHGEFTMTSRIVGTRGYMAPEYLEQGLVSPKADVYAFGVVLLELVTGRDVTELEGDDGSSPFAGLNALAGDVNDNDEHVQRKLEEFVDPAMAGSCPRDSVVMMVRLIERCLQRDAASRPSMGEAAQYLLKLSDISAVSSQSSSEYGSSSTSNGRLTR